MILRGRLATSSASSMALPFRPIFWRSTRPWKLPAPGNKVGAFVCSGRDDGKDIVVNVGSGFSDSDRDSYWRERDAVIGNIVEVRADAITQNQDGTYSLRFPRFLRFRGFEVGEKI